MTMLLPPFELHQPDTLDGVLALMKRHGPENVDLLAGGSDLLCNYKWNLNAKPHVVSLMHVGALTAIDTGRIGACVTLRQLAEHEATANHYPVLAQTARKVASVLVQQQATVGGNLMLDTRCHFFNQSYFWRKTLGFCLKAEGQKCWVVPKIKRDGQLVENCFECVATNSSDLLPVFITLGAELELLGPGGVRRVKASGFYCHDGIKRFDKKPGEILTGVLLPDAARTLTAGYKKLRPRESWDFPVLGVAAAIRKDAKGVLDYFSLAVNAVDTHPIVFDDFTKAYLGKRLDEAAIAAIAEHVRANVQPKLNVPMEPGYRKKMAAVFTRRLLTELTGG